MKPDEQVKMIEEIERDLERLHALYNQYFMGIEKTEPTFYRKSLDRKIYALRRIQIQNTALRFRFQMQIQKYNTQSTYWNRVCKQIEQGTYTRHVMLAKRRVKARHGHPIETGLDSSLFAEEAAPPSLEIDMDEFEIDLDEPFTVDTTPRRSSAPPSTPPIAPIDTIDDPFADALPAKKNPAPIAPRRPTPPKGRPLLKKDDSQQLEDFFTGKKTAAKPSLPPPVTHAPPPAKSAPEPSKSAAMPPQKKTVISQDRAKAIYKKYLLAKKRCNESTENLSYRRVAKSLQKTYAQSNSNVDFKVVIRNGKAVIKTVKTGENK